MLTFFLGSVGAGALLTAMDGSDDEVMLDTVNNLYCCSVLMANARGRILTSLNVFRTLMLRKVLRYRGIRWSLSLCHI